MKKELCFSPADILLPQSDFEKWAVIACDQYTSEPEYWQNAKKVVGNASSALNLILPEVYLSEDNSAAVNKINAEMKACLEKGLLAEYPDSIFYVERTQGDGRVRRGIIGKIDLTAYDFTGTDKTADIRATEKTVAERIPPRVEIRRDAPLELPHAMLLIDDPARTVIEPLSSSVEAFEKLYDFDLMLNGGHIKGFCLNPSAKKQVLDALSALSENNELLFCVGDGNHSLATAKTCYEKSQDSAARYALVEVVNIHDTALDFEPIYRVVFGVEPEEFINAFVEFCGGESSSRDALTFKCITSAGCREISVKPENTLAVGALQEFLNGCTARFKNAQIDYIHGEDSLVKIASRENAVGFLFKGIEKSTLFPAVASAGSLPRKTFSMGHADDKRFYIEARRIKTL